MVAVNALVSDRFKHEASYHENEKETHVGITKTAKKSWYINYYGIIVKKKRHRKNFDIPHSGRPIAENVYENIGKDRRMNIYGIAKEHFAQNSFKTV